MQQFIYLHQLYSEIDEFYDYLSFCIDTLVLESTEIAFIVTGDFNPNRNNFRAKRVELQS